MRELASVAAQQGAQRVVGVHGWLGALCHLTEEHFREHFIVEPPGTCADGAAVTVQVGNGLGDRNAQGVIQQSQTEGR